MYQWILTDWSPLNQTVSPALPWMLKPLTAGQGIFIFEKYWIGSDLRISLSHPLAGSYKPEFRVQWVLKRTTDALLLLELYLWSDPEDLNALLDERARLEPHDLWALAGVQLEVRVNFPQTVLKVARPDVLTLLSDQEFAHALPQLQADIASRWNWPAAERNARYRQDVKDVLAL
jgi:hypothetical protein